MLDEYGFEIYEENAFPVAYLLTFRTFGTWLPGNEKGSVQRSRDRRFRVVHIEPNVPLEEAMRNELKQKPVILNPRQRTIVAEAIKEVCAYRDVLLHALSVRSTHVHAAATKAVKPEKIVNDFKVYATRKFRESHLIGPNEKVWARGARVPGTFGSRVICRRRSIMFCTLRVTCPEPLSICRTNLVNM